MLYKYVKSQPIIIRQKKDQSLYPLRKRKSVYGFAVVCLCFGLISISYSLYPYAQAAYLQTAGKGSLAKSVLTPSANTNSIPEVLGKETAAPTQNYTDNVNKNFANTNKSLQFDLNKYPELESATGTMRLSIPKLDLKKLPVAINVDSYDEKTYMPILSSNLAHFKGTSLPDHPGNTFIYGHSTNELWARTNPSNPIFAFTYLNKLDIGDEISLEYKDKTYKYILQKVRVVSPDDISSIYTYNEKPTLTLMTCTPAGVGTDRLILIADQE